MRLLSAQICVSFGALGGSQARICAETAVRDVCLCNGRSSDGYLCSGCKSGSDSLAKEWGYGCALPCPSVCTWGCDFEGNCLSQDGKTDLCPKNCKENVRDKGGIFGFGGSGDGCLNTFGQCEACESGWSGLRCETPCPTNCDQSPEGVCDRIGMCYRCKEGFYGEQCENDCPEACPKCMMKQGLYNGELLDAGQCTEACQGNLYGRTCTTPCPANCELVNGPENPNCDRGTGKCIQCAGDEWWGDQCDRKCPEGCASGMCAQADGQCFGDCKIGFWGSKCNQPCPPNTRTGVACSKEIGLPEDCEETYFPAVNTKTDLGHCNRCPLDCKDALCRPDGTCEACEDGFWGERCENECESTCGSTCDQATGKCHGCKQGYTGPYCRFACHKTCHSCAQYSNEAAELPGDLPEFCTDCPLDEPSILDPAASFDGKSPARCICIQDASRPAAEEPCVCNPPQGSDAEEREEKFVARPKKKCLYPCKPGRTETYDEYQSLCLTRTWTRAIFVANGFSQGSCAAGEYQLESRSRRNPSNVQNKCVKAGFVDYLVG
mmetsp:Transcript_21474/g.52186  ORF Transcript_21474/g.52186 Transcript_21474/m.52186 type:complete len:549 (+) Transcript_21474:100-1746(+)